MTTPTDRSDYYKAQLEYAQRLSHTQNVISPNQKGGADPTMKQRMKLWNNTFSAVWASHDYNLDYTGLAIKMADEALEAFDNRFCRSQTVEIEHQQPFSPRDSTQDFTAALWFFVLFCGGFFAPIGCK